MNDLILANKDTAILKPETAQKIAEVERRLKEIKSAEEELKTAIFNEMELKGVKKIETEEMTITYTAPYQKESFRSKDFRTENPDLYDEYVEFKEVKGSISIRLKGEK